MEKGLESFQIGGEWHMSLFSDIFNSDCTRNVLSGAKRTLLLSTCYKYVDGIT
jgi:hypothetical protein